MAWLPKRDNQKFQVVFSLRFSGGFLGAVFGFSLIFWYFLMVYLGFLVISKGFLRVFW